VSNMVDGMRSRFVINLSRVTAREIPNRVRRLKCELSGRTAPSPGEALSAVEV